MYQPGLRTYDFADMRRVVCTAYQTLDFKMGFGLAKADYEALFLETLPYPIQEHTEAYTLLLNMLEEKIATDNLSYPTFIPKNEVKQKYGFTEKMFELFYPRPDDIVEIKSAKERFGKRMNTYLYNENKVIELLDSEAVQTYLARSKNVKNRYLGL